MASKIFLLVSTRAVTGLHWQTARVAVPFATLVVQHIEVDVGMEMPHP